MKKVKVSNNVGYAFLIEDLEEAKKVIDKWRKAGELLKLDYELFSMSCNETMEKVAEKNLDVTKMTQEDFDKIAVETMELKSPINGRFSDKLNLETSLRESSDIIFSDIDLSEINWTDVPLVNFTFTGTCKIDAKKMISDSYSRVDGCVFMDMDLSDVDWSHKTVDSTIFDNCKMNVNAVLSHPISAFGNAFANMDLTGVNWENTHVCQTIFHNSQVNYVNMIKDANTIFATYFNDIDLTGVDVDLTKHNVSYLELCRFSNCVGISDEFKHKVARHNILKIELFERSEEEGLRDVISIYDPRFKSNKDEQTLDAEIKKLVDEMFSNAEDDKLKKHLENVQCIENILVDIRMNTTTTIN